MGKPSRVKKLELKAKRAPEVTRIVTPNENSRRAVRDIFRDAKNNRAHGNSSGGGHIPSAKHVGGAVERTAFSVDGTRAPRMGRGYEATERYDEPGPGANRPLERYRAPSLKTRVEPARPAIEPDYGRVGKGAPAVKAREARIDEAIARKNEYARRGDFSGEGPALLPLPPIEVVRPYPRPEVSRATCLRGPGLSVIELDKFTAPETRVFRADRLKGRRYARVRIPAKHGFPALIAASWVPFIHRAARYHPGYDTSGWKRVHSPEECVYRALVML